MSFVELYLIPILGLAYPKLRYGECLRLRLFLPLRAAPRCGERRSSWRSMLGALSFIWTRRLAARLGKEGTQCV